MVADPGQHRIALLGGDLFGRKCASHIGRVDRTVAKPPQIHLVVARGSRLARHVAIGVQTVHAQHDPREAAWRGAGWVHRQPAPAKILHGFHIGAAHEPEQRTMGVDDQRGPINAAGKPRQQRSAQTDRRAGAQAFVLPPDSVADGDVDAFVLEIPLLIGHICDQFLVDAATYVGQVNRLHRHGLSPNPGQARRRFNPSRCPH